MGTQGCVHTDGEMTPLSCMRTPREQGPASKPVSTHTPLSGTTCFALKLGTLTWEVCFPPVGHLMSFLLIPLSTTPKAWPRESLYFPRLFREVGVLLR